MSVRADTEADSRNVYEKAVLDVGLFFAIISGRGLSKNRMSES